MTDEQLVAAINSAVQSNLKTELAVMKNDLLDQIHSVGAQLHSHIQEVDQRLSERLDRMEARLDRQGGLIQSGSRAIVRMIQWTESDDLTFSRYDRRLTAFEKRLQKIEEKQ